MRKLPFCMLLLAAFLFFPIRILLADTAKHPHILVSEKDREAILGKIRNESWAAKVYASMLERIDPCVERHRADPRWILDRYQMNWNPGQHYTDFYASRSLLIDSMGGNAPVPTVRVATEGRIPVNKNGHAYRMPAIEDLVPRDTSLYMLLTDPDTGRKERVKPRGYIESVNSRINTLALEASILYWLTGKETYAKFGADILDQWAAGAWHQQPVHGPGSFGFIGLQTLNDQIYQPLILAYDFLYPYLKARGYELKYYQDVFGKFARTILENGYWNNNWYAAEGTTLVYAALSLTDETLRTYYLDHFFEKDIKNGSWGHLSLRTTVDTWLTPDGHWKEPGGYHTYPVLNLLKAALALEKNGYSVFSAYPSLFRAATVMMKYVYPNLRISSFGDSGRAIQSSEMLEVALVFAGKYAPGELPGLLAVYKMLSGSKLYDREKNDYYGLLCYLPEIKENGTGQTYRWKRSGVLDFARFYLQRNGTDKETGLMYTLQCATYNHNHVNGMSMELYGCGEVMGIDPGTGPYYEHPLHREYFSQWAAHNTVVAGGRSSSVPFSGGAGTKQVGELRMEAMEPLPEAEALSPDVSFTDSRYTDKSTGTHQQRTMALIRTSSRSGYYVDLFRSDHPARNDYMYHNIGRSVTLADTEGRPIPTVPAKIDTVGKDYPGFRYIRSVQATGKHEPGIVAEFLMEASPEDAFMRVLIPGGKDRTYYTGFSPECKTAGPYSGKPVPTLMVQTLSEAWTNPFALIYEPYRGTGNHSVESVAKIAVKDEGRHLLLHVKNKDRSEQYVFQGCDLSGELTGKSYAFAGHFGVASLRNDTLQYLYLGCGRKISFAGCTVQSAKDEASCDIRFFASALEVSADAPVNIALKGRKIRRIELVCNGKTEPLPFSANRKEIVFTVPRGYGQVVRFHEK